MRRTEVGGRRRVILRSALGVATVAALALVLAPAGRAAPAPANPRDVASAAWTSPGYWVAGANGGVSAHGGVGFYGSAAGLRLSRPVVGMATTLTGRGYWLVASDGGIFAFGDAAFYGSTGAIRLNQPIVGMAATPSGRGYWLVASDGGIFRFGDAGFYGSAAGVQPAPAVTAMAPTPSGHGYWLTAADGRVFRFGDAPGLGSAAGLPLGAPIVGMAASPDAGGYLLVGADGGVFSYGNEPYRGGGTGTTVAVVAMPPRVPARVAVFYYPWYASPAVDGEWRHWDQGGHVPPADIGSDYYPERGAYSSSDASVVDAQMAEISAAGVGEVISSWWGRGSFEDEKLPLLARSAAAHGLELAVQIEPYAGRTADQAVQDIAYLQSAYGVTDFFVYRAQDFTSGQWAPALASVSGATVWAESFWDVLERGGVQVFAAQAGFSGVYTYDPYDVTGPAMAQICGAARQLHLLCSPSVAPGFSAVRATGQGTIRPRDNGATYDSMWQGALQSSPDLVTIASYNEWHEGSQIEPAVDDCLPGSGFCYANYDGAYGMTGAPASSAYLGATAGWSASYHALEAG